MASTATSHKLCKCMSVWGSCDRCKEIITADGAGPSYFPLLKHFTAIYYCDLAVCAPGCPSLPQHPEATSSLLCLLSLQVTRENVLVFLHAHRARAQLHQQWGSKAAVHSVVQWNIIKQNTKTLFLERIIRKIKHISKGNYSRVVWQSRDGRALAWHMALLHLDFWWKYSACSCKSSASFTWRFRLF